MVHNVLKQELNNESDKILKAKVRALLCLAAVGAELTSTIMSMNSPTHHRVQESPPASVSATDIDTGYDCDRPFAAETEVLKQAADSCINEMNAPIALVTFDIAPETAQRLKIAAGQAINDAYDGLPNPKITLIPATEAAESAFHAQNKDCADSSSVDNYMSHIADETMRLERFNRVIGITAAKSCAMNGEPGPDGVANYAYRHRYVDVYSAPDAVPATPESIKRSAAVIAHEFGHSELGLGHSGYVAAGDPLEWGSTDNAWNITALLEKNEFKEYGQGNVMGNVNDVRGTKLNSFQRRKITWPLEAWGQIADPMYTVNLRSIHLEKPTSEEHDFITLALMEPVVGYYRDLGGEKQKHSFDTLVVDPIYLDPRNLDPEYNYANKMGVSIYLADSETAQTLALNVISGESFVKDYIVGDQSIRVEIKGPSVTVTDTTPRKHPIK